MEGRNGHEVLYPIATQGAWMAGPHPYKNRNNYRQSSRSNRAGDRSDCGLNFQSCMYLQS
eukprot:1429459-Karenia_brevis.AAC.1